MRLSSLPLALAFALTLSCTASAHTGDEAFPKGNDAAGLTYYTRLAERGDAEAQFILAQMYETGDGVDRDDAPRSRLGPKGRRTGQHQR
jgi:TPR repeat protein